MGKWRYGVILDAGSSGTRAHIYRWLNSDYARTRASEAELQSLPVVETQWVKKIHPGISTFGDNPHDVGPDHLEKLLKHALKHIPLEDVPKTPLFLLATAGMRILPEFKQKAILEQVCDFAKKTTQFQLPDCDLHVKVIPGETEGLYGWIAANYLLGGFNNPKEHDHGKDHHTYGFLDMGGASAQIAFAPNATEAKTHANDLTLTRLRTLNGESSEYRVFVTTWLGFGANQARQRYVKALLNSSPDSTELPDPCLPSGLKLRVTTDGKPVEKDSHEDNGHKPYLLGTGQFSECISQTYPLLEKNKPCTDTPCLINGQHVPAIDFDVNHFVGVSEYWHTTHEVFEMAHKDKAYDLKTYQQRVDEFCSQKWTDIQKSVEKKKWGKKVDETTAEEVCFKASWLINMLHDGIGVPRVGHEEMNKGYNGTKAVLDNAKEKGFLDPFQAVNKIDGTEVSWTLGKMVLYASSEVPATSEKTLAVGFGSNEPGMPAGFQHAGGEYQPYEAGKEDDWHEHLFSDSSRRMPGFLIFVLIVFVVGFMLCGRERRKNMAHKVFRIFGRKPHSSLKRRRGFRGKLFSLGSSPSYERVLESGEAADDFELGSFDSDNDHSDSSDGSRIGRTSGWATPQIKAGLADPPTPGFESNILSQGQGLGLGPPQVFSNAIERGGLMSRTDSRERMAGSGRKSRSGSPTRLRSPMLPLKEFVD